MSDQHVTFVGKRVVIVEDDEHVTRIVSRWLSQAGAFPTAFALGDPAVADIIALPPDLVLLDMNLPDRDGLSICAQLRTVAGLEALPILVMTGYHEPGLHVEALEARADDYVQKPVGRDVLLARAGNLLRRSYAEAQNAYLVKKLSRYVSSAALDQALHLRPQETIEAAVLFSDVRDFTRTSYDANLNEIFSALNTVLTQQSRIVREHHGYVDKFSGDGMLAIFTGESGPANACAAATAIVRWAELTDRAFTLWSPLPIGLGIHYGQVARGDIGDDERREYTVIGHTVNLAARLCGVASPLEVVVTEAVLERAGPDVQAHNRRELAFKGVPTPTAVLSLCRESA